MTVQPAPLLQIRSNDPKQRRKPYRNPPSPVKPPHRPNSDGFTTVTRAGDLWLHLSCSHLTGDKQDSKKWDRWIYRSPSPKWSVLLYLFSRENPQKCLVGLLMAAMYLPVVSADLTFFTSEKDGCTYFKFQSHLISRPLCTSSKSYKKC